jgi:hypothetical protein
MCPIIPFITVVLVSKFPIVAIISIPASVTYKGEYINSVGLRLLRVCADCTRTQPTYLSVDYGYSRIATRCAATYS